MQTQLLSDSFSCHGEATLKCNRPPTDSEIETFSAKKGKDGPLPQAGKRSDGCQVGGRARDARVQLPA